MTQEQYESQTSAAVKGLPHTGDPEFDHLVDEIQRPDVEAALEAMAVLYAPSLPSVEVLG